MFNFKTHTAAILIGLLSACGGSDTSPETVFTYQELASIVPGTSTIVAAGLTQSSQSGLPDITNLVSGTFNRVSRELSIDGIVVDGTLKASGDWTDGTTTVSPSSLDIFENTTTYDFFVPVTVTKDSFASQYIFGVASRTQDLPTDSSIQQTAFTFTGVANVQGILGSDGTAAGTAIDSDGLLSLDADFASGLVDIEIYGLSDEDMPFDRVKIVDLDISSGINATFGRNDDSFITFEGGDGTPFLGATTTESASGAFFGGAVNEIVAPSEAGGVFTVNGENGNIIYGIFAADGR